MTSVEHLVSIYDMPKSVSLLRNVLYLSEHVDPYLPPLSNTRQHLPIPSKQVGNKRKSNRHIVMRGCGLTVLMRGVVVLTLSNTESSTCG